MRIGVVFMGTDAVRILSKGVGRDRPQDRVKKATGVCRLRPASAGHSREADETPVPRWSGAIRQAMRGMMPILSVMKIGRDRPQLCARESTEKLTPALAATGWRRMGCLPRAPRVAKSSGLPVPGPLGCRLGDSLTVEQPALTRLV